MAYYGNQPIAGETNSFKVLDDISSYTKTFDGSSAAVVSTSDDTLTFYDHRFIQGQRVTYGKGGGGTVITGLTDATVYYIIREDKDTIKLATSASNAAALTAVDLTGVGGGTSHRLNVAFDGTNTKFKATTGSGTHIKLTRPGQLMISMNGVVQEPQNNTPSNGFGIEGNNVIVFSTAPTVLDTFWGHYLTTNLSSWELSDNKIDNFTGNGSTTTYTLSKTPANADNILVTIDGVTQYPSDSSTTRAYSLSASVVTFTSAPTLNAAIAVRHIGFAGGSGGGSGSGGVTGFYGRTGNVSMIRSDLQNTDINLKNLTGVAATFTGNVSIGGTLTYTDVTNIDSIGIVTAQNGINVLANGINVQAGVSTFAGDIDADADIELAGNLAVTGVSSFTAAANFDDAITVDGSVGIADSIIHLGNTDTSIRFPSDDTFAVETAGLQRFDINASGNLKIGTAAAAGGKLYFESTSGAAQYIASGGTNNQDLIVGSSAGTKLTIAEGGNIVVGSFTPVDTRNTGGIHIRDNRGISFKSHSSGTSRNWRIRGDDSAWGNLDFSVGTSNSDWGATQNDAVLSLASSRAVGINTCTPVSPLEIQGNDGVNDSTITFTRHGSPANDSVIGLNFYRIGTDSVAGMGAYRESAMDDAYLAFHTQPTGGNYTERLRIASSGLIYVNRDAVGGRIDATAGDASMTFSDGNGRQTVKIATMGSGQSRTHVFDGTGRFLSGLSAYKSNLNSSADTGGQVAQFLGKADDVSHCISLFAYSGTSNPTARGAKLQLHRARSTDGTTNTAVAENDLIGTVEFKGNDATSFTAAAKIDCFVDEEPGTDDMPGRLVFSTSADGSGVPSERLRIDRNGFIKQKFTSNNSTTAEGLFINNLNNGTGNNASLIFSNDSGERKKAALAHIDMGNYGHGDFVFALDGGDSGSVHLTNDERVRIKPSGVDYTLKVKGADQVEGYSCDTWSASLYFSSGTTHTICTMSTGGSDSQVVATMDYCALYSYASNNRYGGQIMAIARKTSSNSSAEATNNIDAAAGGSDSNIKPSFFWDVSTPGAIALKVTTGGSVQVVGRIQVTYKDTWTLTRNYAAE